MSTDMAAAQSPARRSGTRVLKWSARVPLFYRVLIANVAIIALGAVGGTAVTATLVRGVSDGSLLPLIVVFAGIGIGLSLLVNVVVLRAAFRPLETLTRTAQAVQDGDLEARAQLDATSDPEMMRLATTLNATLDELAEDRGQLRVMASQVIRAQEDERRRVSRELHDDTAQILFAQILQLGALKSFDDPAIQKTAATLEQSTVEALEGVRRLALELRPPALDDLGLAEALAELCQRFRESTDLRIELNVSGMRSRLEPETELVLYRIAQEAMTNVVKHACGTEVVIDLVRADSNVTLSIRDDGIGFDRDRLSEGDGVGLGLGLFGMEERASLLGGTLQISSHPGEGSEVNAYIPLRARGKRT